MEQPRWTRRGFLAATIAAALAACSDEEAAEPPATDSSPDSASPSSTSASSTTTSTSTSTTVPRTTNVRRTTLPPQVSSDPFTLGVASGDPREDSVVLWTRLQPSEDLGADDLNLGWAVATDPEVSEIVASGAGTAFAALGHSVHVDATGLEPDREYWYRFYIADFESPVGRTRTFAASGTTPDRFRFAFSSCQNWEHGYYAAYRDVVEQGDLDAFVFLGDYIYEYASGGYADERSRVTGQDFECVTLDHYRQRYALYRSDPLLQAAHALVPWIITWDDHEVDNDYAAAGSEQDDPFDEFLARRAAGYQAWYEFMPVRLDPPTGPDFEIHRSFAHGDLIRFHVLDTRQYRSDQQRSDPFLPQFGDAVQVRDETLAGSLDQSMLGAEQRAWLLDGVEQSRAVWDVVAQQVFMFGANVAPGSDPPVIVVDTWDGYAAERRAILDRLAESTDNLVVLTGDFHSAAVGDLRPDPFDLDAPVVGTEFMASSISSLFVGNDDDEIEALAATVLLANPQIRWFDTRRGYTVCEVTPERWRATFRVVADQFDEASSVDAAGTWEVASGRPGAVPLA